MKARILGLSAALLCAATMATPVFAQAVDPSFTYQGRLSAFGSAVNSAADFQFRLFDTVSGGNQIGSTLSTNNVGVVNGLFTVPLNFGSSAFNGDARYLEIAVRSPAGTGNFVILTPRQPLSAAPYAYYAARPWVTGAGNAHLSYSAGSVGITGNNTNPALLVTRNWDNEQGALTLAGDRPTLRFTGGAAAGNQSWIAHVGGNGPGALEFYRRLGANNWGQVMSLTASGNVGIGTSAPVRPLTVVNDQLWTARFANSHPVASVVEFYNSASDALWELGVGGPQITFGMEPGSMYFYRTNDPFGPPMVIRPNHWVGLGSPNPQFRLELPNIGNADGRGRANQWSTYSSIRWKENVEQLDGALEKVKALRGVSFDWKAEHGGTHDIGFVAEEVGQIVPEIVNWEKDGKFAQSLAYDRITALAVEAIKEQQSQIDEQSREIEDLRAANDELRQHIAEIAQRVAASEQAKAIAPR